MQGYDFVMIGVLVGAIAWGAWKGFAWQVASTASMVLSYFVALNFRAPVAQMIKTDPPWNVFLAMLILFLGTSLVVWLCFNFVSQAIERMKLKEFDRQVGALVGFCKGVILCVIITLFAMSLLDQPRRQAIINSRSGMYIAQLLAKADAIMPQELRTVLAPYVDGLENNLTNSGYYAPPPNQNNPLPGLINSAIQTIEQNYQNGQGQGQPPTSYYGQPARDYRNQPPLTPSADLEYRFNSGSYSPYDQPRSGFDADRYGQPVQPPSNRPY